MKLLTAFVLAALPLAGCNPPEVKWETRGDRVLGLGSEMAEDPVTGTLIEKRSSVQREYRGTTYYFESGESAAMFDANPSVYSVGGSLPPHEQEAR
jgi:YHS domain-containing protein